jgi:hypothetical protein
MKKLMSIVFVLAVAVPSVAQWRYTMTATYPNAMYTIDTTIFVYDKSGSFFAFCPHSDLRYYADTGLATGLDDKLVTGLVQIDHRLFAAARSLFTSSDNGRHWEETASMFPYGITGMVAIDNTLIFNWHRAIQRSTDFGKTWTQVSGLSPGVFVFTEGILYAASATQFFRSLDSGFTWEKRSDRGAGYMVALGNDVFVGPYHSSDGGANWEEPDSSLNVWALATDGTNVYAAGNDTRVYATTDRGRTWLNVDATGLPGWFNASAMCVFDSFVYVGGYDPETGYGRGMYYRPISEILQRNAVASHQGGSPAERLDAYPNPFGTSCTVAFTLDAPSEVRVALYDATGREVRSVYSGSLPPGLNTLPIDGSGLADGIYWCRLQANGTERVVKVSLLRR